MKKVLFCMLTLLFTATLFIQPCFSTHWFFHKYIRGYPTEVADIVWMNNTDFIIGGRDHDDHLPRIRKLNIHGTTLMSTPVSWTRGLVTSVAVPSSGTSYVVCAVNFWVWEAGNRGAGWYWDDGYLASYYTDDGDLRKVYQEGLFVTDIANDRDRRFGGNYFFVATMDNWLDLWNMDSRQNPVKLRNHRMRTNAWQSVSIDWQYNLLVADGDNNVNKRDAWNFAPISLTYSGHTGIVNTVKRCGNYVVAGDNDGYIRIYDYFSGHLKLAIKATNGSILDIDCGPRRNLLAVSSSASLRIWNFDDSNGTITLKKTFLNNSGEYRPKVARFSPTGYYLAVGTIWGTYIYRTNESPAAPTAGTVEPESPPIETNLLSNFPNPFNPETWIPYQLAKPAEVTVSIHSADGKLVRMLELGQLPAGVYQDRERAAYWDGRNEQGESVASGVYFYTLKAGDFAATKKMLIRK